MISTFIPVVFITFLRFTPQAFNQQQCQVVALCIFFSAAFWPLSDGSTPFLSTLLPGVGGGVTLSFFTYGYLFRFCFYETKTASLFDFCLGCVGISVLFLWYLFDFVTTTSLTKPVFFIPACLFINEPPRQKKPQLMAVSIQVRWKIAFIILESVGRYGEVVPSWQKRVGFWCTGDLGI